ncbi:MAG: YbaN family protein [Candidatus Tectomicrobia bacterium]
MTRLGKHLYILAGWLCLGLGFLGVFLPLLPTTPFILLAAFCFSRGSAALHQWLLAQKSFGPLIRDWNQHGIIRPRVKWTSCLLIVLMMSYPVIFGHIPLLAKIAAVAVGISVIGFIWSRPSQAS